jgi:hypothetical protein
MIGEFARNLNSDLCLVDRTLVVFANLPLAKQHIERSAWTGSGDHQLARKVVEKKVKLHSDEPPATTLLDTKSSSHARWSREAIT